MSHPLHRSSLHYVQEEGPDQTRRSANSSSFAGAWQNTNGTCQNCNTPFHSTSLLVILSRKGNGPPPLSQQGRTDPIYL